MGVNVALVIVGGGGFANEVFHYALDAIAAGLLEGPIRGIVAPEPPAASLARATAYLGPDDDAALGDDALIIAIGNSDTREKVARKLAPRKPRYATVIHPSAYVATTADVGAGAIVAPFAFVGPEATLGEHSILNVHASIGHDARIGPFATLSPHAAVSGNAELAERVFLGTHASVVPGRKLGARCQVAAGSVVTLDAGDGYLLHGNPAKGRVMFPETSDH